MEFKVKNKIIEIKFDYRTMFKVDKQLATKNKETGASNNDGVGTLFNNILNRNDEGIVDLITLSANKAFSKAISEDDAITAIENWLVDNDADDTESLFEEIQQEMVDSGFFKNKILKYIENLETAVEYMKAQEDSEALQIEITEKLIGKMKSALS
ncbi:Phage tail assembly chaperone protein, TAC [Streptococcus gallolyticus]|uniref:Phage tail assembly chaperone protein, TAC n=1 Tax=Streptococcus gallolyticus TaxID=315405 RepID=A0A1I7JL86_9STRE|nr:tail assembly chaperone [Streptococcus gallolyticus]SFC85024.1 Phage tail assembly chaperone protein, TAC [Streptococcus gallolyticus]SFU85901.1 Phage tail assembly chaperone protein, TAC [Streptococcus gallolyticus]